MLEIFGIHVFYFFQIEEILKFFAILEIFVVFEILQILQIIEIMHTGPSRFWQHEVVFMLPKPGIFFRK